MVQRYPFMNIAILLETNTWFALLMSIAIGGVAAYIGSLMVTKRTALMAGALGHLALPGMALALRYHFDVSFGALLFLIGGIFFIWVLERITQLPFEALTAIVFSASVATAFLFLPEGKSYPALLGNISELSLELCIITVAISVIIFGVTRYIFKRMLLISISPDIAQTLGVNSSRYNFIYLICIALMVALGVRIVGGLMTAALVAIPASTSKNLSANLTQYAYLSLFFGCISCILGVLISLLFALPIGSTIILTSTSLFFISLIGKILKI